VIPFPRLKQPKDFADATVQINKAFEMFRQAIMNAGGTGGVPMAEFLALQAQVKNLTALSGNDINNGGTGNPAPTPATQTVTTDGTTITGDGGSSPISLVVPVTLPDGGTGIVQAGTQQITTNGTLIGAGTAQAQPALTLPGVTTKSAVAWSLPNVPDATWQTGIAMIFVCTANTVTPYLINPTAAGITPIAQLVNIKVIL